MAQKLALALIALFGLANADVVPYGGVINIARPIAYAGALIQDGHEDHIEQHSEYGPGPRLGYNVKLGEGHSYHHDDDGHFNIINFAAQRRDEKGSRRQRYEKDSGLLRIHRREEESDHKPRIHRREENSDHKPVRVQKIEILSEEHSNEHRFNGRRSNERHSYGQKGRHENQSVKVPIFGKLKYVDNDEHGELGKAPITIVTAPLVSTARIERHQVGINQVLGKPNSKQIIEEKLEGKQIVRASNKALLKDVDKLSTEIQAPIKKPFVRPEPRKREERSSEKDKRKDTGAAKINYHKLKQDLAIGEARENAPFVVGKVLIASEKKQRRQKDTNDVKRSRREQDSNDDKKWRREKDTNVGYRSGKKHD